jgi:hypothetical protein
MLSGASVQRRLRMSLGFVDMPVRVSTHFF